MKSTRRNMEVLQDGEWKVTHHRSNLVKGRHWYQVYHRPHTLVLEFDRKKKLGYDISAHADSVKELRRFLKEANRQLKPFLKK